jgi:hypothetical protein
MSRIRIVGIKIRNLLTELARTVAVITTNALIAEKSF